MCIDQFRNDDIAIFCSLAAEEGWLSDRKEFDFLFRAFPQGCFVCRIEGVPAGFVTSVKYGKSGWVGNLLVREEMRGQGIGASLFSAALEALSCAEAETIWLTASEAGKNLYLKLGFTEIDTIQRWVGRGVGSDYRASGGFSFDSVVAMDMAGWGDRREALIASTIVGGEVLVGQQGFLISQPWTGCAQIGPWGGECPTFAAELLDMFLGQAGRDNLIFLDVPAGNAAACGLLKNRDFTMRGETTLMYRGLPPAYEPMRIFALASMGSYG